MLGSRQSVWPAKPGAAFRLAKKALKLPARKPEVKFDDIWY
jgi:hypothetical protein